MADDRKKKGGEPVLEFFWDSLELAVDQTYSTTLRIKLTGWWEGGMPREVGVSVYQRGQEPPDGNSVRIQKGNGSYPLTGLEPGHHYLVVVYIGDRLPVQKMIAVPELPKPPKPKCQIKVLQTFRQLDKLEVILQRIGEDGKPEAGEICILDFGQQGGLLFGDHSGDYPRRIPSFGISIVYLPYFDQSRRVTFFLPDDTDTKAVVEVPARVAKKETEAKPETKSAGQRITEAFQRGRRGELLAAKDPAKVVPLAAVAGGLFATILAFRGPEGPGGK